MMHFSKLLPRCCLLLSLSFLYACGNDDNAEPPAELTDFEPRANIVEHWSNSATSGIGQQYVYLEPLILDDTIVTAGRDGDVVALDADSGDELRNIEITTSIAAGVGGNADTWLLAGRNGELIALDVSSGKEKWRTSVTSEILATPVLFGDSVYVRTVDGYISNIDLESGDSNWNYSKILPALTLRGNAKPVLTRDWVIIGMENGHLVALDHAKGEAAWDIELSTASGRSEIDRLVDIDGDAAFYGQVLYAVGYQGRLAAIDIVRGQTLWTRPFSSYSGVSVDDNAVYVTDDRGHVWAIDRFNGATLWKQDALTARSVTRPVIFGDYLVVGDYAGVIHLLSPEDGSFIAREFAGSDDNGIFLPPVVHRDRLIVTLRDGELIAYSVNSEPDS